MIDLHIHSTFSDGGVSPLDIMKKFKSDDVIILTDHNNFAAAKKYGVLPGIEIEVKYCKQRFHMLLYNFDINCLKKYEKNIRRHEIKNFIKNCSKLRIKPSKKFIRNNCYLNKIKINNLLVEMNFVSDGREAFYKFTKELPDLKRKAINLKEVFRLEKISGGILSLAHPYKYYNDIKKTKNLILFLKNKYGLRAVECYSNYGSNADIKELALFCEKNNLLISGGSDYHAKYGITEHKKIGYVNNCELKAEDLTILKIIRRH